MKSLNKVYENDEMFYYCNSCGEISIPGTNPLSYHLPSELPTIAYELYQKYWNDNNVGRMYVVEYKNKFAIAINYIFDEEYLAEILDTDKATSGDMVVYYNAILEYARKLEWKPAIGNCEVLVGYDTDPDGHELIVIIPYDEKDNIETIIDYLDDYAYDSVAHLIKKGEH